MKKDKQMENNGLVSLRVIKITYQENIIIVHKLEPTMNQPHMYSQINENNKYGYNDGNKRHKQEQETRKQTRGK